MVSVVWQCALSLLDIPMTDGVTFCWKFRGSKCVWWHLSPSCRLATFVGSMTDVGGGSGSIFVAPWSVSDRFVALSVHLSPSCSPCRLRNENYLKDAIFKSWNFCSYFFRRSLRSCKKWISSFLLQNSDYNMCLWPQKSVFTKVCLSARFLGELARGKTVGPISFKFSSWQ